MRDRRPLRTDIRLQRSGRENESDESVRTRMTTPTVPLIEVQPEGLAMSSVGMGNQ
jgi:hypothetical protein